MIALLTVAVLGLVAGVSIGAIGVGGVIIVPALVELGGVPVHAAIALAMAGYILTGLIGTWAYVSHGTMDWRAARLCCLGAVPGAVGGALAAKGTPGYVLELIIAVMALGSGLQGLFAGPRHAARDDAVSTGRGLAIGVVVGFLSALTGTGGPAVMLPILLWLDAPLLLSLGLSQAIQVPIAVLATASNVMSQTVDPALSLALGLSLPVGAWFGAQVAHRLDHKTLRRLIALVFMAVGILMAVRAAGAFV